MMDDYADGYDKITDESLKEELDSVLAKTKREVNGDFGDYDDRIRDVERLKEELDSVLEKTKREDVPLTDERIAKKARAKELVDELFNRVPWNDFMDELSGRGHTLKTVKEIRKKNDLRQTYYTAHMNADSVADQATGNIRRLLDAAYLLTEGLDVEEGEPDAIKTLISSAISEAHKTDRELRIVRKRVNKAEED